MDVGDGLRKVVVARVACKLPPQSALNLGFSTLWLRIGLGICWVWLLCLIWYFSMGWFSFFLFEIVVVVFCLGVLLMMGLGLIRVAF